MMLLKFSTFLKHYCAMIVTHHFVLKLLQKRRVLAHVHQALDLKQREIESSKIVVCRRWQTKNEQENICTYSCFLSVSA